MRRDKKRGEVPAPLLRLKRKFTEWRNRRMPGQRIPRPLWNAAAKLAAEYGLSQTATVLGLDYYSLKRRVDQQSAEASVAFIELPSASPPPTGECIIELEDAAGASMRIQLKGTELPDLLELGRSFWNAD